ncbi:MAG: hypothetical protein J3R72DRAFT_441994 [Linnemannia gamsii]|nr:MAG: hypothetical protein J3R72DRAFT_441994 [Linnemannia gamsii]
MQKKRKENQMKTLLGFDLFPPPQLSKDYTSVPPARHYSCSRDCLLGGYACLTWIFPFIPFLLCRWKISSRALEKSSTCKKRRRNSFSTIGNDDTIFRTTFVHSFIRTPSFGGLLVKIGGLIFPSQFLCDIHSGRCGGSGGKRTMQRRYRDTTILLVAIGSDY